MMIKEDPSYHPTEGGLTYSNIKKCMFVSPDTHMVTENLWVIL